MNPKLKLIEPKYPRINLHLYSQKTTTQSKQERKLVQLLKEKNLTFYTYQT